MVGPGIVQYLAAAKPVFAVTLTVGSYLFALKLSRRFGSHPLVNPTLVAILVVDATLWALRVDYADYLAGASPIQMLLGPAVVGLALPIVRYGAILGARLQSLALALIIGCPLAVCSVIGVGHMLGGTRSMLLSLAPRSTTTAVAMGIAEQIGGIPQLTAVLTISTGIIAAVLGVHMMDLLGIRDPVGRGFALGLGGHGIATARAFQESQMAGAAAGLEMGLSTVASALLVPLLVRLIGLG